MSLFPHHQWTQRLQDPTDKSRENDYLVSTDTSLLSIAALDEVFRQEYIYWAKPMPAEHMQRMINTSMCFGLYIQTEDNHGADAEKSKLPPLIGFGRLVTDTVTFAYLTDLYVLPEYQGTGLGTWMLKCMDEVLTGWPHLRRMVLFTTSERSRAYYERVIGAEVIGSSAGQFIMGKRGAGSVFSAT